MNEKLDKAQDVFLEKINQICREFGLNNVMAQLYAILYLCGKPLSLNDMMERLKISKGSVSVNIRALERYGVARRVWVKGTRKDYYEAEADISKVILDRIQSMASKRLLEVRDMLASTEHALKSISASDVSENDSLAVFAERLGKLRSIYARAESLFGLLKSGLANGLLGDGYPKENKKEIADPAVIAQ